MTSIVSVDAVSQYRQRDNTHSSEKDFARELAKHEAESKADDHDGEKSTLEVQAEHELEGAKPTALSSLDASGEVATAAAQATVLTEAQQLAQATVAPTGVTEVLLNARVFGWHALAQAYLSELTVADDSQQQHDSQSGQDIASESDAPAPAEGQASLPQTMAVTSAAADTVSVAPQVEAVKQSQFSLASDDGMSASAAPLSMAEASATSYWAERSLRFTRQRDGTSVAWLRDFRISDKEIAHLIQFVVSDAKAKGVVLSKVMLNGREAWSSSNGN
jgi:hypothetical protein